MRARVSTAARSTASRQPEGPADRSPPFAALLLRPGPIEDPQLPNTFGARSAVTLRFAALPCLCGRILLYGIKAAGGGVGVAESGGAACARRGRSRSLRAAWRPGSRGTGPGGRYVHRDGPPLLATLFRERHG